MARRHVGLTLSGGGIRSFYQLGMLREWGEWLVPQLASVAATSAGSCTSLVYFSGRDSFTEALFNARRKDIQRNFDWTKLRAGENPFPHEALYREVLSEAFNEDALGCLRALPFPIWVLCARIPTPERPLLGAMGGVTLAMLDHYWRGTNRPPTWTRRAGFEPRVWDARSCETGQELTDLVVASSATPPMIAPGHFRGEVLVDGFVINNTPSFVHEEYGEPDRVSKQLVIRNHKAPELVSRPQENMLCISPDYDFLSSQWDYTKGTPIDRVLERGHQDAVKLGEEVRAFLSGD